MFADDTKIWARISRMHDSAELQQDLDNLMKWPQAWLLNFNPDKCKIMHIGHNIQMTYRVIEGQIVYALQEIEEKDLGVITTRDLKSESQCKKSESKAMSVMGLIQRNFSRIDRVDFNILYKGYIRPHLEYAVQACSPHLRKDIDCF
jgi:hypothetical protein